VYSLPKEIKERRDKMGFVSPDEAWVRDNSDFFTKNLSKALHDYDFITDYFLQHFQLFLEGKRAYEAKYFRAVSLVIFCEEFNIK
jgi:hypothetical protein